MKPLKLLFIFSAFLLSAHSLFAQVSKDAAVQIDLTVGSAPLSLDLHWPADANTTGIKLYRRLKGASSWGAAKPLANNSSGFLDTAIVKGTAYEYRVVKTLKVS